MLAMQFGEIDALAVEAEGLAEDWELAANRGDPPALVAERGFIGCDVVRGVQVLASGSSASLRGMPVPDLDRG